MKYILPMFFIIFSTACSKSVDTKSLHGEWWGKSGGKLSRVMKIDETNLYYPKSAGHYKGKWTRAMPYSINNSLFGSNLVFKRRRKEYTAGIKQPDENTLQLIFDKNTSPPWDRSAKGKTLIYKRTPKHVDDNHFHGKWVNRKGGFKSLVLEILPDGTASLRGTVSDVKLCWLRSSGASIKVELCDKTSIETLDTRTQNFYIELSPTPVKELIVVEISKKKSLWIKSEITQLNWLY